MNNVFKIILGALLLIILAACSPMAQSSEKHASALPTVVEPQTPQPRQQQPSASSELLVGEALCSLAAFQSAIRSFREALSNSEDDEVTALAHFGRSGVF